MIKSNDLRLGNIFKYEDKIITLYGIEDKSVQILKPNMSNYFHKIPIDWIEPIELTEEILLKCGFTPCSIIENNFNISGMCVWKCNEMFLCDKNGIHIKHLHQLQNLYWCLCEKELNVNI